MREIPKTASEKPQDRFLIEALRGDDAEIYEFRNGRATRVVPAALRADGQARAAGAPEAPARMAQA